MIELLNQYSTIILSYKVKKYEQFGSIRRPLNSNPKNKFGYNLFENLLA